VEVDAAERMDLVRLLDVRRTPTVFVLGPDGQIARRGSGLMNRADVLGALDEIRAG
jgi:diacylglycerol kinase family enzyme